MTKEVEREREKKKHTQGKIVSESQEKTISEEGSGPLVSMARRDHIVLKL